MNVRTLTLLAVIAFSLALCFGQATDTKPAEPTAIGEIFQLDGVSQTLKPLPSEQWVDVPKRTGFAHGGFFIQMEGDHSPYRIKAGTNSEFVFKVSNPEGVALYAFTLKKKKRLVEYEELLNNWGKRPIPGIPAEISQFGQSSFKLVPKSALAPGEYVIYTGSNMFTFGIDQ
jgi:hypothetical protein